MGITTTTRPIKDAESPPNPVSDVELLEEEPELTERFKPGDASKERKLPPFPAKSLNETKSYLFWEWADKLVQEDFDHLLIYLYREHPIIDRKAVNPNNAKNIDKLGSRETCNLEYVTTRHGSGLYQLLVNDVNKTVNGKGGTIGIVKLSIQDANRPPILLLEEVVTDHPSNRTYVDSLKAEGKITSDGRVMIPNMNGGENNAQLIGLVSRLLDKLTTQPPQRETSTEAVSKMFMEANSTAMGMLKEQVRGDGPDKLVSLIAALKEMIPKPETNSMLEIVMKMQLDATARADASQARLMEVLARPPEDATGKLLTQIQAFKELGLLGGGEEGRSYKKSNLEVIVENTAPIMGKVLDVILNVVNMKNYKSAMTTQAQGTVAAEPGSLPQPQGENVIEMPPPVTQQEKLEELFTRYGGLIIGAMQRGQSGDAFGESVEGMAGPLVYQDLASLKAEGLLAAMKSVPAFWSSLMKSGASEMIAAKFCEDFVAYGEAPPQEEEEEGA